MIFRKKTFVILMAVMLMVCGASNIFAAEGDADSANLQSAEYKAGMVTLESILGQHPDTQNLYTEYQDELNQIETASSEEGNDKEAAIESLNQKYITLLKDQIQGDLDDFTIDLGLDVLFIDNIVVSGNTDLNPDDVSNITDVTQYLEAYFTESNSTTTNSTEE